MDSTKKFEDIKMSKNLTKISNCEISAGATINNIPNLFIANDRNRIITINAFNSAIGFIGKSTFDQELEIDKHIEEIDTRFKKAWYDLAKM